mgnify:CR=1 FL=1
MAIGERIRFFRNLRGMTQKWLGQAVGFPQKTADIRMAQYESGSRVPDMATLIEMANFFGVKLDALLNADDKALISNVLLYSSMTQIEHELLETFAALSDYSKGKLLERAYILHEEENQFLKDLDYNPEK